jgi:hypothetical protein
MAKYEIMADLLLDCDDLRDGFCQDCPEIRTIPQTLTTPEERICPTGFDHTDPKCFRAGEWAEILDHLKEVAQICNLKS